MKKIVYVMAAAILLLTVSASHETNELSLKGAWRIVRAQYGDEPVTERSNDNQSYKLFTGTRWSAAYYNKATKEFKGAGGGTYTLKGDQYRETIEYYSWENEATGQTITFTISFKNGMLHQKGTMVYKGNPNYLIDEWYERVD